MAREYSHMTWFSDSLYTYILYFGWRRGWYVSDLGIWLNWGHKILPWVIQCLSGSTQTNTAALLLKLMLCTREQMWGNHVCWGIGTSDS